MAQNSPSCFSSETGFFHWHSRRVCLLPLRMPQWQWRFLHSSLLQWKISLSTLNACPPAYSSSFCLWNSLPQSVCLTFFLPLSLALLVGCLHLSWQLCASSPAIWNDSSHPGATARAVYWERAMCVHIHALSFTEYHTHAPLHPGLNSEMRLL